MSKFLKEVVTGVNFELLIDTNIFPKDIILKAAYNFLDKGYFFFRFDENQNIILEFTKKQDVNIDPETVIGEFSDELLDVYLRDKLERDNRVIRETIVTKAINGPLDMGNFISYDSDAINAEQQGQNEIDFDKDIDDILKEIENDPDLQVDEGEIDKILQEIETESAQKIKKPEVKINLEGISAMKASFNKKK